MLEKFNAVLTRYRDALAVRKKVEENFRFKNRFRADNSDAPHSADLGEAIQATNLLAREAGDAYVKSHPKAGKAFFVLRVVTVINPATNSHASAHYLDGSTAVLLCLDGLRFHAPIEALDDWVSRQGLLVHYRTAEVTV